VLISKSVTKQHLVKYNFHNIFLTRATLSANFNHMDLNVIEEKCTEVGLWRKQGVIIRTVTGTNVVVLWTVRSNVGFRKGEEHFANMATVGRSKTMLHEGYNHTVTPQQLRSWTCTFTIILFPYRLKTNGFSQNLQNYMATRHSNQTKVIFPWFLYHSVSLWF
jgi:hypothetical protein